MTIDEVVMELQNFIYYLAHRHTSEDTVLLEFDEIVGELSLELVKGFNHYKDSDLSDGQLLAVIRRILDNRISELIHRYFGTHRQAGNNYIPVDELSELDGDNEHNAEANIQYKTTRLQLQAYISMSTTPEELMESSQRVEALFAVLSPEATIVLNAILQGNELLAMNMQLSIDRSAAMFKSAMTKLQPWHVADSIGLDEKVVRATFKEIRMKYAEVCEL